MTDVIMQEEIHEEKVDIKLWRQILRLSKPYRRYIIYAMLGTVAMAGGDALFPYMTKVAIDRFVVPQTTEGISWFALAFVLLIVAQSFNVYVFINMSRVKALAYSTNSSHVVGGFSGSRPTSLNLSLL